MTILFHGAQKLDAAGQVDDFWMTVEGGDIVATGSGRPPATPPGSAGTSADYDRVVDVEGHWLTPGFIDLHGHGGGGHSFENGPDEIRAALETHRSHGTTRSLISLVANPLDQLETALDTVAAIAKIDPLVLGAHLEGPYLAPGRTGAHNPAYLLEPQPGDIDRLLDAARGTLRQITIAPELPNALESIRILVEAGVVVAVGHTDATFEEARDAFRAGARLLTHAFNAMPGIHHRAPGPVVAAFDNPEVAIELILDGMHVHPEVAALVLRAAPGRVALITDAMAAAGAHDGEYSLGSMTVTVQDGLATLRGTSTIAGSTLTQDHALRVAIDRVGATPRDAVAALTATPARVLGIDHRYGRLAPGFAADAVVLDRAWSVRSVWADGRALG